MSPTSPLATISLNQKFTKTKKETEQFFFSNPVFSISPKSSGSNEFRSIRSFEKILSSMDLAHLVERKTMSIYDVGLYEKIYKINAQAIEDFKGHEIDVDENDAESVDDTRDRNESETGSDRILETSVLSDDYSLSRQTSTPEVTVPCLETTAELMMKAERVYS